MNCDRVRELFSERWADTLENQARISFECHLNDCPACRNEWSELNRLWARLNQLPEEKPGPGMRPRFYAMLEAYQAGVEEGRTGPAHAHGIRERFREAFPQWQPAFRWATAALLLVLAYSGGYLLRSSRNGHEELVNLREEVHQMRQMVTVSLLKQQSASDRLKGVSWSMQIDRPDPEFISTLLHTLDYDTNIDVRLAAVDALSRFTGDAAIRSLLIQSLAKQKSPMVQIALIDLLVQLHERASIDILRQLTNDMRQNQLVRERAERGIRQIS